MKDLRGLWDFQDPAASEVRFREYLPQSGDQRHEVLCQIARTYGLRKQFDLAEEILEEVLDEWDTASERARVCFLLELGRIRNSSGDPAAAKPIFLEALGEFRQEVDLKVDVMHMLGIVETGDESLRWNLEAIAIAEASDDPKARRWLASLLNNTAWSLHDLNRYDEALALFERAVPIREAMGQAEPLHVAKWAVARCKRSLGRYDEALFEQRAIYEPDKPQPYVNEEIGENLWALGR
ncbi:MAG: tetratricopeptide repeat protein, partial [Fimbriimonadaceae bacterium]